MKRNDGHTPTTYAKSIVLTEIVGLYRMYERHLYEIDGTPAFQRAVLKQLAKLHNTMLDASGLDGLHIEVKEEANA